MTSLCTHTTSWAETPRNADPSAQGVFFQCLGYLPADTIEIRLLAVGRKPICIWPTLAEMPTIGNFISDFNALGYHAYWKIFPSLDSVSFAAGSLPTPVLWADLDWHDSSAPTNMIAWLYGKLGSLPRPTAIVHSGRGLHCYWRLEERVCPAEAVRRVRGIAQFLGSDQQACSAAQLLRLPGFNNHHTGTKATIIAISDACYLLNAFPVEVIRSAAPKAMARSLYRSHQLIAHKRAEDLKALARMRGTIAQGFRERYLWLLRKHLEIVGYSAEDALEEILAINDGFASPLPSQEVICATVDRSPQMPHTNSIIEWLEITTEEQGQLSTLREDLRERRNRRHYAAKTKEARTIRESKKAKSLTMRQEGIPVAKIAKTLGISTRTIFRWINCDKT